MYRRRHSGLLRAAAWAASTSKNRNKELPCLLMCPKRCLPALESSLGIIPTYVPICLPRGNRSQVPMINQPVTDLPGVVEGAMLGRKDSESVEPLGGRLGAVC